jgi:hypothetical protein
VSWLERVSRYSSRSRVDILIDRGEKDPEDTVYRYGLSIFL